MFSKDLQYECIDFQEVLSTFLGNHFEENDRIDIFATIQNVLIAELIQVFIVIMTSSRIKY